MTHLHDGPMAGRTVLVTGATSGIGLATALGLATQGAHVAITGRDRRRTQNAAREVIAAEGVDVDVFVADLSSQAQVRRLASEVLEGLPRIDVLINNVGGYWSTRHITADGLERPDLEQVSGRYFANRRPTRSSTRNYDQRVAARLWEGSAVLVGLTAAPHV